jgi:hypothetical protein
VGLKNPSELELHSNYSDQAKASLVYGGRENGIDRKESKSDVINRNLVQIIPSDGNKLNSKHNLNDDEEMPFMRRKEFEAKNIINHTLKKEKRILMVGDSHVKGMASEIQHQLKKKYAVQGIVNSGADIEVILGSNEKEIGNLTNDDFLIIWGGVKEVCKNEAQKSIKQIREFVRSNLNTNVIVINLPYRRDLVEQSCVNKEIDNYNRRLGKHLKGFDHVYYKVINYERKFHTKHGMHLNTIGKEYVASQLSLFHFFY